MHENEWRRGLHRRHDGAVRTRCAFVPLGLLALSACGNLEIGSYGVAKSDSAGSGSGPTIIGGSGATSSSAGADFGSVDSGGASSVGGASSAGGAKGEGRSGGDAGGGKGGTGADAGSDTNGGEGPSSGAVNSADIGDTGALGTTVFDDGVYTIEASGADIGNTADSFRYLYDCLTG